MTSHMLLRDQLIKIFCQRGAHGVDFPDGWAPLLNKLHNGLFALDPDYRVSQVKVKFGGLRFYPGSAMGSESYDLIRAAKQEAERTCEECAGPGVARKGMFTFCDAHAGGREAIGGQS